MTLTLITGPLGSGKTAYLSLLALRKYRDEGRRIWANYRLSFAERVAPFEVLTLGGELEDVVLCGDEFWLSLDSRASTSGTNEALNEIILASRKRGVDIIGTAQMSRMVDVRFRGIADYVVMCNNVGGKGLRTRIEAFIGFWDMGSPRLRAISKDRFRIADLVYNGTVCYDTKQVIEGDKWLWLEEMAKALSRNSKFVEKWNKRKTDTQRKGLIKMKLGRGGSWLDEMLEELRGLIV